KTFGQTNTADFAAGGEASKHFASIGTVITDLDAAKATQQKDGTTSKAVLLDALRLDVQNITRTARAIDQDEPGFAGKFPAPKSSSDKDLITDADAILGKLTPASGAALKAKFVAHELDANFVQHLQDDRAAIDNAADDIESDSEDS